MDEEEELTSMQVSIKTGAGWGQSQSWGMCQTLSCLKFTQQPDSVYKDVQVKSDSAQVSVQVAGLESPGRKLGAGERDGLSGKVRDRT